VSWLREDGHAGVEAPPARERAEAL
jgi:hypothetical protein